MCLRNQARLCMFTQNPICKQFFFSDSAETNIVNAAFEDIAPCPCDLTRESCDKGCCCDSVRLQIIPD